MRSLLIQARRQEAARQAAAVSHVSEKGGSNAPPSGAPASPRTARNAVLSVVLSAMPQAGGGTIIFVDPVCARHPSVNYGLNSGVNPQVPYSAYNGCGHCTSQNGCSGASGCAPPPGAGNDYMSLASTIASADVFNQQYQYMRINGLPIIGAAAALTALVLGFVLFYCLPELRPVSQGRAQDRPQQSRRRRSR